MKKVIYFALALAMLLSGCGNTIEETALKEKTTTTPQYTKEPEQAYASEPDAEPTAAELNEPGTMSEEELDHFSELLSQRDNLSCLVPEYEAPSQAEMDEIFYSGIAGASQCSFADLPPEEQKAVKATYFKMPFMEGMTDEQREEKFKNSAMLDMIKLTNTQINEFLTEKFGLTFAEMDSGLADYAYVDEYGAWYRFAGDTNAFILTVKSGYYKDKDTAVLVYSKGSFPGDLGTDWQVTLRKSGDDWLFDENLPIKNAMDTSTWQKPPYTQGIITDGELMRRLPDGVSEKIYVSNGTYVDVMAAVETDDELWLYVHFAIWDTPQPESGWIPANYVEKYTAQTRERVLRPLTLAEDAVVYNENTGKVQGTEFVGEVFIESRQANTGKLPPTDGEYAAIGSIGGWTGVVDKNSLVYPEIRDDFEIIVIDGSIVHSNFDGESDLWKPCR